MRPWAFGVGYLVFVLVATANAAGYRYGVSDQAFYIPAVARALQPDAFPRDASLIDSQARFLLVDDVIASLVRATGIQADRLFLGGYLLSLALIWLAIALIGRHLYASVWLTAALAAAFTMRHRIPRTSANSFEPYFHPRMLAFACGALAIAALLRRRYWGAVGLVCAAAIVHVTTALWFAVLIGVALLCLDRRFRRLGLVAVGAAAVFVAWAAASGILKDAFTVMDDTWLAAVASKDSLFASDWPWWAWAMNLSFIGIAWAAHYRRWTGRPEGSTGRLSMRALLIGATALVVLFLVTLPFVLAKVALPVQLQISRVFWLVDFVALLCVIGLARSDRAAKTLAALLVAVACIRGVYVTVIEHPERALFAVHLPDTEWEEAAKWLAAQPSDIHVLADPGHAWKYGTSVRVSATRDVVLEETKDSAIAIYSRDVAERVVERSAALANFDQMTADRARDLAGRYDADYLVTETDLPLPMAFRNARFRIYALPSRTKDPGPRTDQGPSTNREPSMNQEPSTKY